MRTAATPTERVNSRNASADKATDAGEYETIGYLLYTWCS
jgi:hypothetical protein